MEVEVEVRVKVNPGEGGGGGQGEGGHAGWESMVPTESGTRSASLATSASTTGAARRSS